jgi:glyoxylate reductase
VDVVSTHRLPGPAWDELAAAVDVVVLDAWPPSAPLPGVEAAVVVARDVGAAELDLLPGLRLVANYGVGYDRVDVAACAARGVAVTNTPGVLDAAVADLTLALVLATRRRIVEADTYVRSGSWRDEWILPGVTGRDVAGSTLGIVGLGRIGSAVARRARAFDMRVLYAQRTRVDTELGEFRELDALFAEADVVSLHVPLGADTRGLVDARRLALLRDGCTLINTSRGPVVEEHGLVRELVSGRISAGLDVFADEPSVPRELLDLPNVVLTPHVGSATTETRAAMTRVVVENVLAAARGEPLVTPVATGRS